MTSNLPVSAENFNERRIFPRFYPQKPVQVTLNSLGADEAYRQLTCLDLSETGLKLSYPARRKLPFRDNSLIEVRLPVPAENQHITFLARLQREQELDDQHLLALRIVQIGVRDKELLRHLIHSRAVFVSH